MGELTSLLKDKYFKSKSTNKELVMRQKLKNSIISVAEKYLGECGEYLQIEIPESYLPYLPEILTDEQISSKYTVTQYNESLFYIGLKELDF